MKPSMITIIALLVVSILVVGLMVFAYIQIIKSTKVLSKNGLLDKECLEEKKHKDHKLGTILINVLSISLCAIVVSFSGMGLYYKLSGEQFTINKKTTLVIATNSMEDYVSDEYKSILIKNVEEYKECTYEEASNSVKSSQFAPGDMLQFTEISKDEELELYNIYGYKNKKGQIIVHRLVAIKDGYYIFRGDNTYGNDNRVTRDQILYQYNNNKLTYVGHFVLFASSGFGIYSLFIVAAIFVMSDVAKHEYTKIKKDRLKVIEEDSNYENK